MGTSIVEAFSLHPIPTLITENDSDRRLKERRPASCTGLAFIPSFLYTNLLHNGDASSASRHRSWVELGCGIGRQLHRYGSVGVSVRADGVLSQKVCPVVYFSA
jgi:hypothetical protein